MPGSTHPAPSAQPDAPSCSIAATLSVIGDRWTLLILRDIFRGIVEIGNDVDCRGAIQCGSILIDNMTIAGSD